MGNCVRSSQPTRNENQNYYVPTIVTTDVNGNQRYRNTNDNDNNGKMAILQVLSTPVHRRTSNPSDKR